MITQRRFDELQLAAQLRAEKLFEKWKAQFLGARAEREQEEGEPVEEGQDLELAEELANA